MQHFGKSTRQLDWTTNPWVATWFMLWGALREALTELRKTKTVTGEMAFFELNATRFNELIKDKGMPIRFFTPDYTLNENANAQEGLMSYMQTSSPFDKPVDTRPMDIQVCEFLIDNSLRFRKYFAKYNMSQKDCVIGLDLCAQNGYRADTLFPNEQGKIWQKQLEKDMLEFERNL